MIKTSQAFAIWWLITWRTLLGAAALNGIAFLVIGLTIAAFDTPTAQRLGGLVMIISFFVITMAWNLFVIRQAIEKRYNSFRLKVQHEHVFEREYGLEPGLGQTRASS